MAIFCDKVQAPSDFSSTTSWRLLPRLRIFLDQLRLAVPPRWVSELQPLALLLSSRGTNQNFGLVTSNSHLRHTERTDLRRSGQHPLCWRYFARNYVHARCDRPMCCAGIPISHEHVPNNKIDSRGQKPPRISRR